MGVDIDISGDGGENWDMHVSYFYNNFCTSQEVLGELLGGGGRVVYQYLALLRRRKM